VPLRVPLSIRATIECLAVSPNFLAPHSLGLRPCPRCDTGLAHLLEHMAFKGTARIGTGDARREAALLDALDEGVNL
jgi:Insulinase (Peptidase family M16)